MYSRLEHTGIFIRQYKLSKPVPNTSGETAQTGSEPPDRTWRRRALKPELRATLSTVGATRWLPPYSRVSVQWSLPWCAHQNLPGALAAFMYPVLPFGDWSCRSGCERAGGPPAPELHRWVSKLADGEQRPGKKAICLRQQGLSVRARPSSQVPWLTRCSSYYISRSTNTGVFLPKLPGWPPLPEGPPWRVERGFSLPLGAPLNDF